MLRLPLRPNRIDILQEKQKFERDGMTEIDGESSILNFLRYYVYSFLPLFINNPEGRGVQAVLYYYFPLGWGRVLIFMARCRCCGATRLFLGGGTGGG